MHWKERNLKPYFYRGVILSPEIIVPALIIGGLVKIGYDLFN